MTVSPQKILNESFSYTSSVERDVWRPKTDSKAYDSWYFDALSEDGRDAIVIIFIDNFIFSPRYNSTGSGGSIKPASEQIPAVAFFYYRDGIPIYRTINEYDSKAFSAGTETPSCKIGDNSFTFKSAPYGSGYFVSINADLKNGEKIEAHFEWLSVEANFLAKKPVEENLHHLWNVVVSRADVTGKISVWDNAGEEKEIVHFRGTGYHDHSSDDRWLPDSICDWQSGRAHFSDSTAIFCRYKERRETKSIRKIFIVTNGQLIVRDARYEATNFKRDRFGMKYPIRQTFVADEKVRLRIKNKKVIDSSFFYIRFLSELTLTLGDGKPRKAVGITHYLAPGSLKFRWLDWVVNLGIGRNGKRSLLG